MSEAHPVTHEDSERKEASEPEEHRHSFDSGDYSSMVEFGLGEAHRHHDEVSEGDDGEDGAEEEEGDLRRRAGIPVAAPPVGDCYVSVRYVS